MENPYQLNYDAVDSKPVNIDWSAQEYTVILPDRWAICDSDGSVYEKDANGKPVYYDSESDAETNMYNHSTEDQDEKGLHTAVFGPYDSDWDGDVSDYDPMMNYYYPLPNLTQEDARTLDDANVNLTIVEFTASGETGLALTGGGMDFSWEICEGYVALGYFPPAHFANLDKDACHDPTRPENMKLLSICQQSLRALYERAERACMRFDEVWGPMSLPPME